ncbi:rhomboid family intramembrane serine protease [Candidatus Dojkabacteria bacterium]|nr:rhomboid family intramembrane serine protease [Candidatus Dojkabacteria bacterium]
MLPLDDDNNNRRFTPILAAIIITNVVVFVIEYLDPNLNSFIGRYALIPALIEIFNPATWYTFITSMFLHAGIMHIFSNMWFLWIFGNNVEDDMGPLGFLFFYIAGGIFASLAQFIFMIGSPIPTLGASGAIAAVLGYYMVAFPENQVRVLAFSRYRSGIINTSAYNMLFIWGITQLFNGVGSLAYGGSNSGVAWFAHLGGFLFGVIFALLRKNIRKDKSIRKYET